MSRSETKHDKALHDIVHQCRDLFGLDRVLWAAIETQFYTAHDNILCEPDVIICHTYEGHDINMLVAEYKASKAHRDRAIQQLYTAEQMIRHYHDPTMLEKYFVYTPQLHTEKIS
jgi:hypothetical protein